MNSAYFVKKLSTQKQNRLKTFNNEFLASLTSSKTSGNQKKMPLTVKFTSYNHLFKRAKLEAKICPFK